MKKPTTTTTILAVAMTFVFRSAVAQGNIGVPSQTSGGSHAAKSAGNSSAAGGRQDVPVAPVVRLTDYTATPTFIQPPLNGPEPSTLALIGLGAAAVGVTLRRSQK